MKRTSPITELIETTKRLYEAGNEDTEIARRMHVDQATVLHILTHGTVPHRQLPLLWRHTPATSPNPPHVKRKERRISPDRLRRSKGTHMSNCTTTEDLKASAFVNVPQELKDLNQWHCWRQDVNGDKIPIQVNGNAAKSNDSRDMDRLPDSR